MPTAHEKVSSMFGFCTHCHKQPCECLSSELNKAIENRKSITVTGEHIGGPVTGSYIPTSKSTVESGSIVVTDGKVPGIDFDKPKPTFKPSWEQEEMDEEQSAEPLMSLDQAVDIVRAQFIADMTEELNKQDGGEASTLLELPALRYLDILKGL